MQQQIGSTQVPQKLMAQSGAFGRTFYQAGNVGDDEALLRTDSDDPEMGMQRCKRIVGHLWTSV